MDDVTFFFGGWTPVVRILVVGSLAYFSMVVLLRVSGKRSLAQMNAFDFIITVALGASFGRILTARNVALIEAVTTFALLITLQYLVTSLQVRSKTFAQTITAPPSLLFYDGHFLKDTLRRERITEAEVATALRQQGVGSYDEISAVIIESNGRFAIIKKSQAGDESALEHVRKAERLHND